MSGIRTGDELASLLKRANEIEMAFENMVIWETYVSAKGEELRQVLFALISDSQRHKSTLDSLISEIKVSDDQVSFPLAPRVIDFKNKHDLEIMEEILRYEKLAFDLYTGLLGALKISDMTRLLHNERDADVLISSLEMLISGEKGHIELVSRYAGKVQRIR